MKTYVVAFSRVYEVTEKEVMETQQYKQTEFHGFVVAQEEYKQMIAKNIARESFGQEMSEGSISESEDDFSAQILIAEGK